ncbi:MAG TPA: phage head closure protein [Peptococcaceae bacterium]|nr:phage head closure protein [Peptococcaceae bacterium]
MTFDHEVTLISRTLTKDEIGNQIPGKKEEITILCGKKSVSRSEFYNAATRGLKPVIVLVVHPYEYGGQTKLKFEGVLYKVIRTYEVSMEELELTCEKAIGNG